MENSEIIAYSKEFLEEKNIKDFAYEEQQEKITLSIVIICKNEEKNIVECLDSINLMEVDEIIIVDTGSKDKTISLISKFIEKVSITKLYTFEWCDNFAAAKNYGIYKASGDWIFFLDADERFVVHKRKSIREIILKYSNYYGKDIAIAPIIRSIPNNKLYNNPRIFCKSVGYKYYGNVHETLRKNKNEYRFIPFLCINIEIEHSGYKSEIIEHKLKRNFKLIDGCIKEEPDNPLWLCYKFRDGRNYLSIEEKIELYDKVIKLFNKADDAYHRYCFEWVSTLLIRELILDNNVGKAKKCYGNLVEKGNCCNSDLFYLKTMIRLVEIDFELQQLEAECKNEKKKGIFQDSFISSQGFHLDEATMLLLYKQHKMLEFYKYKDFLFEEEYIREVND